MQNSRLQSIAKLLVEQFESICCNDMHKSQRAGDKNW